MLHKTRGLVLQTFKYSETSVVTRMYTEAFGRQSYIVNGVRTGKGKAQLLRPATLLDMVVYQRDNKDLQRISEFKHAYLYTALPFNILKITIAQFLVEVLNKTLQEEEANPPLFNFLYNAFVQLDRAKDHTADFHLHFLVQLSAYLGFTPAGGYTAGSPYFDMMEGEFVEALPEHRHVLEPPDSETFSRVLSDANLALNHRQRSLMLNKLLEYYRLHVEGFDELKSVDILHEVLS